MKRLKRIALSLFLILLSIIGYNVYMLLPDSNSSVADEEEGRKESVYSQMSEKVKSTVEEIIPSAPKLNIMQKNEEKNEEEHSMDYILLYGEQKGNNQGLVTGVRAVLGLNPETYQLEIIDLNESGLVVADNSDVEDMVTTVEEEFDISIKNYVQMSEDILPNVIDSVGGITIQTPEQVIQLDGKQTVEFLQKTSNEELEDLNREMLVTNALIEKLTGSISIGLTTTLLGVLDENVETDMGLGDILSLVMTYAKNANELEVMPVNGQSLKTDEE